DRSRLEVCFHCYKYPTESNLICFAKLCWYFLFCFDMRYTHAECQVISLDMESKVVLGSILELGPYPSNSKDAIGRIKRLLRRLQPNRTAEEEALIEEFGPHWSFAGPTILPQPCGKQCTRPHHHYSELEAYIWKYFKDALIHDRMVASAKTHQIYMERLRQINKCTPEE
ncbi:CpxR, partial [Striga asiatica]